jgi:hypothetical protein
MHKNEAEESDRALLGRVKKEMDEPRMAESTREELRQPDHAPDAGKANVVQRNRGSRAVRAEGK